MIVLSSEKFQCALYLFGPLIKVQFLKETSSEVTPCVTFYVPSPLGWGHDTKPSACLRGPLWPGREGQVDVGQDGGGAVSGPRGRFRESQGRGVTLGSLRSTRGGEVLARWNLGL